MTGELLKIAGQCDGVPPRHGHAGAAGGLRAHLGPQGRAHSGRRRRRWVRKQFPDFRFMAEVYWDLEWALQQQSFDYAYDKHL